MPTLIISALIVAHGAGSDSPASHHEPRSGSRAGRRVYRIGGAAAGARVVALTVAGLSVLSGLAVLWLLTR